MKLKAILGHIRNILIHKYWVIYYGRKIGVGWWRLLVHDLSKFSYTEFKESVKYYQGDSSPIPACKAANGFSYAWQHHKGRNKHHFEYWLDNKGGEIVIIPMPYECVMEMIADWMAAGRTYNGKQFAFSDQCDWWEQKKQMGITKLIHTNTVCLLDTFFNKYHPLPFDTWKNVRPILNILNISYNTLYNKPISYEK